MSVRESDSQRRGTLLRSPGRFVRSSTCLALAALLGFAALESCSTSASVPEGDGGAGGSSSGGSSGGSSGSRPDASSGSSGGSGSSGASSSGSGSSGGSSSGSSGASSSGVADAGGDGALVCTNMDRSVLQEDTTGFIFEQCNEYQIQGSWYCFSDQQSMAGGGQEGCVKGTVPYVASKNGMCLQGTLPASFSSYVGIGLELNATGGTSSVKQPYDAPSHGIIGFAITLSGTTSESLRVGFTDPRQATVTNYVAPFATVPQLAGSSTTEQVLFASVPPITLTGVGDTGAMIEPNMLEDIQIELAGQMSGTETYNFCITSITPIFQTDGGCPEVSGQACDVGAVIGPVGDYAVQNNVSMGGSQCVNAMPGSSCAQSGFTVTFPNGSFGAGGNVPSSYPSFIYGWQNGGYYGVTPSPLPKLLSTITTVPTTWNYSVPGGTTYDAAYDIWLGPASASGPGNPPGLELMVWTQYSGPTPAGSQVATGVTINGKTWDVYKGQVNSWQYLAYRAQSGSETAAVNLDLNNFFKDATTGNKYNVNWNGTALSSSWYLWGVQAGFEIYNASQTITTSSFQVSVQ